MAWLAVNKNKDEFIFLCKPKKVGSKELKMPKEYFWKLRGITTDTIAVVEFI